MPLRRLVDTSLVWGTVVGSVRADIEQPTTTLERSSGDISRRTSKTAIFHVLLKPVSKDLSLLAAPFGMLQTAILCANKLDLVTIPRLLGDSNYPKAFAPSQVQAPASLSLALHEQVFGVGGSTCKDSFIAAATRASLYSVLGIVRKIRDYAAPADG
jgi:hypothetical protein